MPARSRVLVVTPECAGRPRSGGEIRTQRLVTALARHADVHVVVLQDTDAELLREETGARSVEVLVPLPGPFRVRFLAVARGWPLLSARYWRPDVARLVRAEASAGSLVVLEHVYLDVYRPPSPYVLSTQNVESEVHRTLPVPRSLRGRVERWWDLWRIDRLERAVRTRTRARVVVVSPDDAQGMGRADALVVENGADLPAEVPTRPRRGRLLYVGSMTWPPNVEAVRWWLTAVLPYLGEGLPRLTVVGRGAHAAFGADPRLDVLDEVPEMAAVLSETSVVVAPLLHGGGTRLKVLEALAWGRPVVATPKAVEGLRVNDGEHVLLAEEPAEFAAALQRVYDDDALAAALAAAGRALVATYDWALLGEQYANALLGPEHA